MSLKKAASSGILWTFLDTVVSRGIGIVTSILLARLLSPTEFGLMGMIYIFTSISASLVDSGLTSSLIRSKEVDHLDYTTIFYTNIGLSFVLYGIIFLCAPLIGGFYEEFELIRIIRVYALIFVITSFSAVQQCMLIKKMAFRRLAILNMPGIILGAAVGISMAYLNYGVWSIIGMQLITQLVFSLMLWFVSDWKPSLGFSFPKLKRHYQFGYRLMLSGLLNSAFDNIYNVVIGKFYSTSSLGQFERAKTFNNYPVMILTTMISKVTYPLMAGIQEEKERLKNVYQQILQFAFFVSAPMMLILSVVAQPLIIFLLGEKWEQAAVIFQILCLAGILYPIHAFNLNLLKVYGRSDWFLKLEIIKKLLIVLVVICSLPFGIYGLVWGMVISSFLALVVNTYYTNKLIGYSFWQQLKDMRSIFFICVGMYLLMYILLTYLSESSQWVQILLPSLAGLLFYIFLNYIMKSKSLQLVLDMKSNLK